MAARGSANGSATSGRGAGGTAARRGSAGSVDVLERSEAAAAADEGAPADAAPHGRTSGRPRSAAATAVGHAQIHAQALAGTRTPAPTGARTLTIGEAAACLSVEFPGTTVAVLRRLEAAGKFSPGHNSAGYRRYSATDLDLLRIVLSDQPGTPHAYPQPTEDESAWAYAPDPADLSGAESPLAHPAGYAPGAAQAYAAALAAQRPAAARTTARAARVPSSRVPATRPAGTSRTQPPAIATLFDVAPTADPATRVPSQPPATEPAATVRPTSAQSAAAPAPAQAPSPATRRAERRWPDPDFFTPDLGEVSLDRGQLAAAARTDRAWIDGLIEYGVLPDTESASGADLLVARASAELAQFGLEPRHLRAVAASAARVAELIAAATTSAGTNRESARRERAMLGAPGRSGEAAAAAVRLHAALVRAALLRG